MLYLGKKIFNVFIAVSLTDYRHTLVLNSRRSLDLLRKLYKTLIPSTKDSVLSGLEPWHQDFVL